MPLGLVLQLLVFTMENDTLNFQYFLKKKLVCPSMTDSCIQSVYLIHSLYCAQIATLGVEKKTRELEVGFCQTDLKPGPSFAISSHHCGHHLFLHASVSSSVEGNLMA